MVWRSSGIWMGTMAAKSSRAGVIVAVAILSFDADKNGKPIVFQEVIVQGESGQGQFSFRDYDGHAWELGEVVAVPGFVRIRERNPFSSWRY